MRTMTGKYLESCRETQGPRGSDRSYGFNGCFNLEVLGVPLRAICSDGAGWDHVSVTVRSELRCPTWAEMCAVKDLFWDESEAVFQLHPPRRDYVNNHAYCLHLWKPTVSVVPLPPTWMVGIKDLELVK